ncbi:putative bifunctional diguanylate cyclase/phosphodiesterase [Geodermatophilus sp. SYSU D00814]
MTALLHDALGRGGPSLVRRTRALFLLLALTSLAVAVATSLPGSSAPAAGLLLASAGVMVLAWVHRYRHGDEVTRLCWLECLVAAGFLLACSNPVTGVGVLMALVWFRALFGTTLHVACYGIGLSAALAVAVLLWDSVPWHTGALPAAMLAAALPGVVLTTVVARHLAVGVVERDRAHRCGTLLAELAADLLAADDLDRVVDAGWRALGDLCRVVPGGRAVAVGTDDRVVGSVGEFAAVPDVLAVPGTAVLSGSPVEDPAVLDAVAGTPARWWAFPHRGLPGRFYLGAPGGLPDDVVAAAARLRDKMALAISSVTRQQELVVQASTDPLTGLPNRTAFTAALAETVAGLHPDGEPAWMLFVDLDDFKTVNDNRGHGTGDRLLRAIAGRLSASLRDGDLFARLGGDEFAVLLPRASEQTAVDVAERLVELSGLPVELDGRPAQVGASVGIACARPGLTAELVVQHADLALYAAKRHGKGRVHRFTPDLLAADDDAALAAELRVALAEGQLEVLYQPIVATADGRCTAVEALVRWRHPERGLLSPATFLGVAEARGLIVPVGAQVLARACADVASWYDAGRPVAVHVNASAAQLSAPGVVADVTRNLVEQGLAADRLVIEVTESSALDTPAVRAALQELDGLGVGIAIDDFGTGYAALTALRELPVDVVKIDKSFVTGAATSVADEAVVYAIVEMAHRLGLETVAEGVETAEQEHFAGAVGATSVQGYLHGRPMTAADLTAWLAARAPVPVA